MVSMGEARRQRAKASGAGPPGRRPPPAAARPSKVARPCPPESAAILCGRLHRGPEVLSARSPSRRMAGAVRPPCRAKSHGDRLAVGRYGEALDPLAGIKRMKPLVRELFARNAPGEVAVPPLDIDREKTSLAVAIEIDRESANRPTPPQGFGSQGHEPNRFIGLQDETNDSRSSDRGVGRSMTAKMNGCHRSSVERTGSPAWRRALAARRSPGPGARRTRARRRRLSWRI